MRACQGYGPDLCDAWQNQFETLYQQEHGGDLIHDAISREDLNVAWKPLDEKADQVLRDFAAGLWAAVTTYADAPPLHVATALYAFWVREPRKRRRSSYG